MSWTMNNHAAKALTAENAPNANEARLPTATATVQQDEGLERLNREVSISRREGIVAAAEADRKRNDND